MKSLVVYLSILLCLVGCSTQKPAEEITAIWHLTSREGVSNKSEIRDPLREEAANHEVGQEGMLLSIFPDHRYTLLNEAGYYEDGDWKWIVEGERIFLSSGNKRIEYGVTLTAQKDNRVELVLTDKKVNHVWQRRAKMLKTYKEDEFHPDNNTWRIKPKKPESTDQLIQRLGNYFKHTTYLLKGADQRDVDVVSFSYADGVVKIYNSGIGVKEWEYISAEWKNSFYSEAQAKEACELFRNYLNNYPYNGTGSGDWVKDDYFLMLHIYNDLMEGKFKDGGVKSNLN